MFGKIIYLFRDIHNIGFVEQFAKKTLRTVVPQTLHLVPYRKKRIKIYISIKISIVLERGTLKIIKKCVDNVSQNFVINFEQNYIQNHVQNFVYNFVHKKGVRYEL